MDMITYMGFNFMLPYHVSPKDLISVDASGTFRIHQRDMGFTEQTALDNLPTLRRFGPGVRDTFWSGEYWINKIITPERNYTSQIMSVDIQSLLHSTIKFGELTFKLSKKNHDSEFLRKGLEFGIMFGEFTFYLPGVGRLDWQCGRDFTFEGWRDSLKFIGSLQVKEPENIVNVTMDSILDKAGDGPVFIQVCQQDYSGMLSVFSDLEINVSIAGAQYDKIFDAKKYQILTAAVETIRSMVVSD